MNFLRKHTITALLFMAFLLCNALTLKGQSEKETMDVTRERTEQSVDQEKDRRVEIPAEALPEAISEDLYNNYQEFEIISTWKWVNDEGRIEKYEVQVDRQGKDLRLKYDAEGIPITLEKEKQ